MKRLHLVTWLVAAVFVAACGSAGGGTSNTSSYSGKTIKLGAILSITGAGGVYGPQSRDGMNLAVKQINNSGGVNGAQIALTINDDASDKAQSAQVAQKLIQEEQDLALLGPTLSNSAVAVHPLAESLKTPILAVSTTGINIVPNCNAPSTVPCKYVFRDSLGEETAIPDNIKSLRRGLSPRDRRAPRRAGRQVLERRRHDRAEQGRPVQHPAAQDHQVQQGRGRPLALRHPGRPAEA